MAWIMRCFGRTVWLLVFFLVGVMGVGFNTLTVFASEEESVSDGAPQGNGEENPAYPENTRPITVFATKVVCEEEQDLPNYGLGGPAMTSHTATDWVAGHESCQIVHPWNFEWNYLDGQGNPGDHQGEAGGNWKTFTGSITVPIAGRTDAEKISFREVWTSDYIPFTFDEARDNSKDVSAEMYCSDDVENYDNWDLVEYPESGETYYCVAWNVAVKKEEVTPRLLLEKSNESVGDELPGNTVRYTLKITALDAPVKNVELTDLPPAGFVYQSGSATGASFVHEYASPGVWNVGDLGVGESKTLAYTTKIENNQDAGRYRDLAYARGTSESGAVIIANVEAETPFVGTSVNVIVPIVAEVTLPTIVDRDVDTKTVQKVKRVLGAATLPLTGADTGWMIVAFGLMLVGLILLLLSKESTRRLLRSLKQSLLKIFVGLALVSVGIFGGETAEAASSPLAVRIETPKAAVTNSGFQIGFTVLDLKGRTISLVCEKKGPSEGGFSTFETQTLTAGGNAGNCSVDAGVLTTDGIYHFRVRASAGGDSIFSESVAVTFALSGPATPTNYSRTDVNDCQVNIGFTTGNDGGKTVKVELYRSTSSSFRADAGTKVSELSLGSNMSGTFSDTVSDCSAEYFYAVRAVDAQGYGSDFVGDTETILDREHRVKTKTVTKKVSPPAASGALAVTTEVGIRNDAEAVSGAVGDASSEGDVLGAATTEINAALGTSKTSSTGKNIGALILLFVLSYAGYRVYQKYYSRA